MATTRANQAILPPPPPDAPDSGVVLRSESSTTPPEVLDFYDEAARPTRSSSGGTPLRPPLTPTMPIKDVVGHDDIPALLCDLPAPPDGLLEAIARAIDGTRSVNDLARLLGCEREIVRTFVAELVDSDLARVERKDRDSRDYWLEGLRPRAPSSSRTPK